MLTTLGLGLPAASTPASRHRTYSMEQLSWCLSDLQDWKITTSIVAWRGYSSRSSNCSRSAVACKLSQSCPQRVVSTVTTQPKCSAAWNAQRAPKLYFHCSLCIYCLLGCI